MDFKEAFKYLKKFEGKDSKYVKTFKNPHEYVVYDKEKTIALVTKTRILANVLNGHVLSVDGNEKKHFIDVELIPTGMFHEEKFTLLEQNYKEISKVSTGEEVKVFIEELVDKDFAKLVRGKSLKEKISIYEKIDSQPISIIKNETNFFYKGDPHTLAFGFEIEFKEKGQPKNRVRKMRDLRKKFDCGDSHRKEVEIETDSGSIIFVNDNYKSRKDVVRIYQDFSVGYEIVTRPFLLGEIEEKTKKIYEKTEEVVDMDCKTIYAGGHVTMMEGQHLDRPLNYLVCANFIQLHRAFYPLIIALGSNEAFFRGTQFCSLNGKSSAYLTSYSEKYNCVNKRVTRPNEVAGLEARYFSSPKNCTECEENAKILYVLWRIAEKISKNDGIIKIRQRVIDENAQFYFRVKQRKKYSKQKEIFSNKQFVELRTFFLNLVEKEARRLNVFWVFKKRLGIRRTKAAIKKEIEENKLKEIIRTFYNLKISGLKPKEIEEKINKTYGNGTAELIRNY